MATPACKPYPNVLRATGRLPTVVSAAPVLITIQMGIFASHSGFGLQDIGRASINLSLPSPRKSESTAQVRPSIAMIGSNPVLPFYRARSHHLASRQAGTHTVPLHEPSRARDLRIAIGQYANYLATKFSPKQTRPGCLAANTRGARSSIRSDCSYPPKWCSSTKQPPGSRRPSGMVPESRSKACIS